MARFHFHVVDGGPTRFDEAGSEHPTLDDARTHARKMVADLVCGALGRGNAEVRYSVTITDGEKRVAAVQAVARLAEDALPL